MTKVLDSHMADAGSTSRCGSSTGQACVQYLAFGVGLGSLNPVYPKEIQGQAFLRTDYMLDHKKVFINLKRLISYSMISSHNGIKLEKKKYSYAFRHFKTFFFFGEV